MKLTDHEAASVAEKVINAYKPYKRNEFTVIASIFSRDKRTNEIKLETIASGNKCYKGKVDGMLTDCHAEVLARRSFVHKYLDNDKDTPEEVGLFTSLLPCGMFSIDGFSHDNTPINDRIIPTIYGTVCRGREFSNLTLYPRTKPGKRQSEILLNMSCSDKILKWLHLGIQGKRLKKNVKLSCLVFNQPIPIFVVAYLTKNVPNLEIFATSVEFLIEANITSSISFWTDFIYVEKLSEGRKQGSKLIVDNNGGLAPKIQSKLSRPNLNATSAYVNNEYLIKLIEFKKWRKGWTTNKN